MLLGHGFGLHAAASVFQERPSEPAPFKPYVGTTELALVEATQLLPPIGDELVRWRVGLEADSQTVKQKIGLTTERDHLRVAYAGVRLDGHVGTVLGWGEITVRQGLDAAGASRPGGLLLSRPNADPQATDFRFTGRLERTFQGGRQLSLDLRGQWTDRPLLLFEQFSYGGLAGGRGLDPDALLGDRGLSGHLEWADRPIRLRQDWTVRPIAYVDSAWVKNVGPGGAPSGRALFGGLGARLSWRENAHLDLAYTRQLTETQGVAPGLSGSRMVITLSAGF
jgi:hemolysin activation/secretion protein